MDSKRVKQQLPVTPSSATSTSTRVPALPHVRKDEYFMSLAWVSADFGKCTKARVGCVITKDDRVIATGYNGLPENMLDCTQKDEGCPYCHFSAATKEESEEHKNAKGIRKESCICLHAEMNAMINAARFGISIDKSTLYVTTQPCFGCFKSILHANIKYIVYDKDWTSKEETEESAEAYAKLLIRFTEIKEEEIPQQGSKKQWLQAVIEKVNALTPENHSGRFFVRGQYPHPWIKGTSENDKRSCKSCLNCKVCKSCETCTNCTCNKPVARKLSGSME